MLKLDHVAVACTSLESGVEVVERRLGVPMAPGGTHPRYGTHNRLLSLGGAEYLEVIAIDPAASAPAFPRWFDLDAFAGRPRPTNWILNCADLDAALADLGPEAGDPVALARGPFRWRMAVPPSGLLPFDNLHPALIEWQGARPAARLRASGCKLDALVIRHPEAPRLAGLLRLEDSRIRFETGPPALTATIATPAGPRVLD